MEVEHGSLKAGSRMVWENIQCTISWVEKWVHCVHYIIKLLTACVLHPYASHKSCKYHTTDKGNNSACPLNLFSFMI